MQTYLFPKDKFFILLNYVLLSFFSLVFMLQFFNLAICLSFENLYDITKKGGRTMLNQVVLVGRLVRDFEIYTTDHNKKVATITLAVPRSFKNLDGIYETDFIDCVLWENVAMNTKEYCHKGDILGIRGRLQSRTVEADEKKETHLEVIGEKVTFLSAKPKEKE